MTCKDGCMIRSKWKSHLDECNSCLGMLKLRILRPLTVSSLLSLWTGVLWLWHLHNASCGICHDWLWLWMKGADACQSSSAQRDICSSSVVIGTVMYSVCCYRGLVWRGVTLQMQPLKPLSVSDRSTPVNLPLSRLLLSNLSCTWATVKTELKLQEKRLPFYPAPVTTHTHSHEYTHSRSSKSIDAYPLQPCKNECH